MDPSRESTLLWLIRTLYEGCSSPSGWMEFLQGLSLSLGSSLTAIHVYDFDHRQGLVDGATLFDPQFEKAYREYYCRLNPWVQQDRQLLRADRAVLGSELFPLDELVRTEFYCDFMRPQRIHHSIGIVAVEGGTMNHSLTALRSKNHGAFSSEEQRLITLLGPHVHQALRIRERLGEFDSTIQGVLAALDRMPIGVILLDRSGRPVAISRKAQEIVRQGDGFALGRDGPLASRASETRILRGFIASASESASSAAATPGGVMTLSRPSAKSSYSILIAPLILRESTAAKPGLTLLFISDPEDEIKVQPGSLRQLFCLTPAEARLTGLLLAGKTLAEVADLLGVSMNTARTHLKRILSKTGTHRQADLIRTCLKGVASLRSS